VVNEDGASPSESTASRVPATLVILGAIIVVAALATLVLPRGDFERVTKIFPRYVGTTVAAGEDRAAIFERVGSDLAVDDPAAVVLDRASRQPVTTLQPGQAVLVPSSGLEKTAIVPGTYRRRASASDESFWDRLKQTLRNVALAPIRGFVDKAEIIGFVLIIGGAFGVILATGAIDRALARAIALAGEGRLRRLVIPLSMLLFSLGGAVFGMGESTIAFVLITVPLAIRLGYDTATGIAMCYLASQIGFAGAFFNPFTVGIAQSIAELPSLSGLGFRLVTFAIVTSVGIAFVSWHASRVRAHPQRSPTFALDESWRQRIAAEGEMGDGALGLRSWVVVLIALSTIALTGVGVAVWDWFIQEMAALFAVAAVAGGLVAGFRPGRIAAEFVRGARDMMEPVFVIALAAGILFVLQEGGVLDTVLDAVARPLVGLAPALGSIVIMIVQAGLNFFVPSGSGQAALTMPIVTPLCDIIGLDRQVGVLAFQFGDGFGNTIIPTSAVLMGALGAARVSWTAWIRYVWPLVLILHLVAAALLVAAVLGPDSWMEWPQS
jgi:uncharacterized ion transporter superfamily protein YfcC